MALWKITYGGNMPGGDVFQHGCYMTTDDAVGIASVLTNGVSALTALLTTAGGMQATFTIPTVWASVTTELIAPLDGSVLAVDVASVSRAGTNVNNPLPGNCAVCVTFRTATTTRSGRGRWYLPCPAVDALTTLGRLNSTTTGRIAVSMNAFWTALQAGLTAADAVVYSKATASTHTITSWDVGDVVDTMRSRRNKLVESRSGAAV